MCIFICKLNLYEYENMFYSIAIAAFGLVNNSAAVVSRFGNR